MKTIISFLLLAVVNLIHCQEQDQMIVCTLQGVLEKLEGISDKLKGHEEVLHRISDMQEKLERLENNLQGLHHELEHVKGAVVNSQDSLQSLRRETGQCLRGDDLEHLTNVSSAAHQEIKSFVHDEMSGLISLAEKDECSEGSPPCGQFGICSNTVFSFTCSCPPGFTWDGSDCADIDECAEGKGVCSPNATCNNSIGSYSCPCNKPFEGDGRTSCEFHCRRPAKDIRGLGCIKFVEEYRTHPEMEDFCRAEGGRLLQHFDASGAADVGNAFPSDWEMWIGVYDEKWTSDESLVPKDLWWEGYRQDPSWRCGVLGWDSSSSSPKVDQLDCLFKRPGLCQFHHHHHHHHQLLP